jgi:colanic acid biosynthesis glycosyl transferase WcaI
MRILVVTLLYSPDGGPSAPLFGMLCENLALRGHEVTVIAAVPHYPSGRVQKDFRQWGIKRTHERGVNVVRVPVPSIQRSSHPRRLVQFACFQLAATFAGLNQSYDVVLVTNPALETWLPFAVLGPARGKPAVFSVHDVYPDVGTNLGVFRHQAIIKAVASLERFCLSRSRYVRVLSHSFFEPVAALGIPREKIILIYDWVDTDLIKPLPRDNRFALEHQLDKQFVVLYAGNIGLSQGLEQVLTTAKLLQDHEDITFVFLGDGAGRDALISQATRRHLGNVKFLPFQPRSRLPEVLATADVSLITLKKGIATASLPSKTFSILASGRPLLASVDEGSDTWELVQRSQAGICVAPDDPAALATAIGDLKNNPSLGKRLGKKGREYALINHSPEAAAKKFEQLLLSALATH